MVDRRQLGKRIQALREALGLSQKALASAAGVAERTIQDIESEDGGNPTLATLQSLATALSVDMDVSFDGALLIDQMELALLNVLNKYQANKPVQVENEVLKKQLEKLRKENEAIKARMARSDDEFELLRLYRGSNASGKGAAVDLLRLAEAQNAKSAKGKKL